MPAQAGIQNHVTSDVLDRPAPLDAWRGAPGPERAGNAAQAGRMTFISMTFISIRTSRGGSSYRAIAFCRRAWPAPFFYPQAHATTLAELPSSLWLTGMANINPNGCWNWWGYSGDAQYSDQAGSPDQRDPEDGRAA
jgi:hypothetical protein